MLKSYISTLQKSYVWGIFTLIMMLSFSLISRQQDFKKETGAQNLEASYHVLLTIAALNESPVKNHWYLPSLSLGREADKQIPWGETIPSRSGDYIYTSFTPSFLLI